MGIGPKPKRAVVLEFLVPGSYLFGYATRHFTEAASGREMTMVFVPNPTTGLLIAVPAEKVRDCDLSTEEATQMLVSGGLLTPAVAPLCPSGSSGRKITNVRLNV
jgi:uncharacterized membrane protein